MDRSWLRRKRRDGATSRASLKGYGPPALFAARQDYLTRDRVVCHIGSRASFSFITVEVVDLSTAEPGAEPTDKRQHAAIPMLLAVIGSVAGTLVTSALSSSPELALLGAALGAAIPPLVAVAGPFTHLRLWGGVLIAVIALVVTYGGFTVRDKAMGVQDPTFPVLG